MDLLEKVFEKYWAYQRRRKSPAHCAELADLREYLGVISGFVLPERGRLQISAGLYFVGIWEQALILPERISVFPTPELNRAAYLGLTLRACMAARLALQGDPQLKSRNAQRIEYLEDSPQINFALELLFPSFAEFDAQLMTAAKPSAGHTYTPWIQALHQRISSQPAHLGIARGRYTKSGDSLNPLIHALIPCLPQHLHPDFLSAPHVSPENSESQKLPSGPQPESKKGEMIRRVDLEKEKENSNPVTHSFEKLETADDYAGGHRTEDGDDALENHSAALEEVELSQVTLSGTPTHSIYNTDQVSVPNRRLDESTAPISEQKRYSEWSESKRAYLSEYCLLNIHLPTHKVGKTETSLRKTLSQRYAKEFTTWRRQLSHIFNEPLWMKRQLDGTEIDLDAAVRYLSDVKSRRGDPGPQRLYAQKRVSEQSLAVHILFDQSLSTDAWVKNRRVIDLILDSVGICGILFDGLLPQIQIAGTWSATRHDCRIQIYKRAEDSWDCFFEQSSVILPQGYTRLGPSIRYSAEELQKQSARRKVLLLLTDGKPSDLDPYEGFHGIHDVKKACSEAEVFGIQTIALAIDQRNRSHFSVMFKNPIVLSDPALLPAQLIQTLFQVIRK